MTGSRYLSGGRRRRRFPARSVLVALGVGVTAAFLIAADGAEGSTAYCLTGIMANGERVRPQSVAHNGFALGTRLTITPNPTGDPRWTVRDRIGHGSDLDFWVPSCAHAIRWGRRPVTIRVGWPAPRRVSARGTVRRVALRPHPRSVGR